MKSGKYNAKRAKRTKTKPPKFRLSNQYRLNIRDNSWINAPRDRARDPSRFPVGNSAARSQLKDQQKIANRYVLSLFSIFFFLSNSINIWFYIYDYNFRLTSARASNLHAIGCFFMSANFLAIKKLRTPRAYTWYRGSLSMKKGKYKKEEKSVGIRKWNQSDKCWIYRKSIKRSLGDIFLSAIRIIRGREHGVIRFSASRVNFFRCITRGGRPGQGWKGSEGKKTERRKEGVLERGKGLLWKRRPWGFLPLWQRGDAADDELKSVMGRGETRNGHKLWV